MTVIAQRDLRNRSAEILRRAEAGERFVVTVSGRPVAEIGPHRRRRWVPRERLVEVVAGAAPVGMLDDLRRADTDLADPFEA